MRSIDRILTTHTGSLARPPELTKALLQAAREGRSPTVIADAVREAVEDVVARQVNIGLDIVNDGEFGKTGFYGYVTQRLSGFGQQTEVSGGASSALPEAEDFPEWGAEFTTRLHKGHDGLAASACVSEIAYSQREPLEADIESLASARAKNSPHAVFMTAVSPGFITTAMPNEYYPSHEQYVEALAGAMKTEYEAIHRAGFLLQIDCPDLASAGRTRYPYPGATLDEWRRVAILNVEALNEATRDIPPEAMRMHVCWGNYPGPHHHDVPLREIVDILLRARPAGLSIEAANPRHEHEWRVFEEVVLPDGKLLLPGVIDSTSNFIEHPELVEQRIVNFARLVGRENVIASSDCGFATLASWVTVDPRIAFAKLHSIVEGARLASKRLWSKS